MARKKATKAAEPIDLATAYDALSQEAFAIWMRLHLFTPEQMNSGRLRIASMTGYSESRLSVILRELRLAGYLHFQPSDRPGHTTAITFAKVCKISGRNRFVKLSNSLAGESLADHGTAPELSKFILPRAQAQKVFDQSSKQSMDFDHPQIDGAQRNTHSADSQDPFDEIGHHVKSSHVEAEHLRKLCNSAKPPQKRTGKQKLTGTQNGIEERWPVPIEGEPYPSKVSFLTLTGGIRTDSDEAHGDDSISSLLDTGINLSRFRKESRAKRDCHNRIKHPDTGKPIDWSKLDQWGKPQITFSPSDEERAKMVGLLTGNARRFTPAERKLKREMEKKLQSEFIRMYERYRVLVVRERGWARGAYAVMEGEKKYALKAAVACIVKGVTPRQVLEYWHSHIGNFADSKMPVPPITFLSQPANIDTVSIDVMSGGSAAPRKGTKGTLHTMSDTSMLHPGFRAALAEEGFDLSDLNDSYLTTIQAYAIDIVSGAVKARLIPAKIRPMVKWAADNFYAHLDIDQYV